MSKLKEYELADKDLTPNIWLIKSHKSSATDVIL